MEISIQTFIDMCQWDTARFLIISDNVFAPLIYYSHFFALIPSFLIGLIIFLRDKKALINQILFFITTMFSLWVFADLVLWANEKPDLIMFFWSLQVIIEPVIYAACVYFIYVFIRKKDVDLKIKFGIAVFLVPTLLFASTKFALTGFDLTNCYRETTEGPLTLYGYGIEIVYVLWILFVAFNKSWNVSKKEQRQIFLVTTGIILFLFSLASGNIIGSLTENWTTAQTGLFGMPVFVAFLGYLIVRFHAFNIKLLGTQALVFALGFLVLAILFIRKIENVRLVVIFTLLFVIALGYALVKSVKKEIQQKEELAKLNMELQDSIKQRENLVHLVTHKVKGSFTRTKYLFAGMLDGTFGEISPEIREKATQGLEFDNGGIQTVDLVLEASNLSSGIIKYEMKTIDLKEVVQKTTEEKRIPAEKKGLKIEMEIKNEKDAKYEILGDYNWLKEAINNLIENSIRYTPKGKIAVELEKKSATLSSDGKEKILFSVKDTGIGITEEDKKSLFTEGGRGKDSIKVNVDSTGYGLFSVKLIIEAHQGKVWAESAGVNKGSTFYLELDAVD